MATIPRLGALDGLRGLAALLVVVYHAWLLTKAPALDDGPVRDVLSMGFLAVTCFFVLSGFVLFLPTALTGTTQPTAEYALRRAARIAPAYWLSLLVALVAFDLLASPGLDHDRALAPEGVLAHLTFTQTEARLLPGYEGLLGLGVNPVLWTLALEVSFYLVLPFVAQPFLRRPVTWVAGALAVSAIARELGEDDVEVLSLLPAAAFDFAAGMAAALLYVRLRDRTGTTRAAVAALVAAGGLAITCAVAGGADASTVRDAARTDHAVGILVPAFTAVLALTAALAGRAGERALANRPLRFLGDTSYGLYLAHFMAILFALNTLDLPRDGTTRAFAEVLAVALPISLLAATASWLLVERPARRWARRRIAARAAARV